MINLLDKANLAVVPVAQKAVGPAGRKVVGLVTRRNKWWNTP
jgi:hypothetical protein